MSKKKGRIITVEGCPCEVIERVTFGVLFGGDAGRLTDTLAAHNYLVVAPDGTLLVACDLDDRGAESPSGEPMVVNMVSERTEAWRAHVRRLAAELNA